MKKIGIIAALLAVCLLLGACAPKLSEKFSADELTRQAEADIALINTRDFDAVVARVREDLRANLTAASLEEAWGAALDSLGAYAGVKSAGTTGTTDKQTGEAYGVTVTVAEYENGAATFTLTYNEALELVGLYMK